MKKRKERRERRTKRSAQCLEALGLQLEACGKSGELDAISVVDGHGRELRGWGALRQRGRLVKRAVAAGRHRAHYEGQLAAGDQLLPVDTARIRSRPGDQLFVCAIGGSAAARVRQLGRCALGAVRILAAEAAALAAATEAA